MTDLLILFSKCVSSVAKIINIKASSIFGPHISETIWELHIFVFALILLYRFLFMPCALLLPYSKWLAEIKRILRLYFNLLLCDWELS